MKVLIPHYYHKFQCIKDRCKHSCCVGWEITIDEESLRFYQSLSGEMGEKIRQKIVTDANDSHFLLDGEERCPFLMGNGLCEMICRLGENALCDICADHPRFRNYYDDFTEMGLGLCCEAVAKIVLEETEPFSLTYLCGEDKIYLTEVEEIFLALRDRLFSYIQNRDIPIGQRLEFIAKEVGIEEKDCSPEVLVPLYLSMERLNDSWTEVLQGIEKERFSFSKIDEKFAIPLEQLFCYFIYRHLWNGESKSGITFAIKSCSLIVSLWQKHQNITIEKMADYVRMYSAEVEYCEENMEKAIQ